VATFVLVHGGWRGGWVRDRVAKQLRENGHTVYAPTPGKVSYKGSHSGTAYCNPEYRQNAMRFKRIIAEADGLAGAARLPESAFNLTPKDLSDVSHNSV
jgi:hypothetical protein